MSSNVRIWRCPAWNERVRSGRRIRISGRVSAVAGLSGPGAAAVSLGGRTALLIQGRVHAAASNPTAALECYRRALTKLQANGDLRREPTDISSQGCTD